MDFRTIEEMSLPPRDAERRMLPLMEMPDGSFVRPDLIKRILPAEREEYHKNMPRFYVRVDYLNAGQSQFPMPNMDEARAWASIIAFRVIEAEELAASQGMGQRMPEGEGA